MTRLNPTQSEDRYLDHPYILAGRLIDPIVGMSIYSGQRTPLHRKQLEVLASLAAAGTQIVTRHAFIERIWRGNALVGEHALSNTIYSLRRALQDSDTDKPLIRTIPRRGYQLTVAAGDVEETLPAPFAPTMPIAGKPGWQLSRRLGGNAVSELWLAEEPATGERRVLRFCRSEHHLQLLRRETTVLRYLRQALAGRRDTAVVLDWQLDEPPYHLEMDYASGGSLVEWADAQGGLAQVAYPMRMQLAVEVAEALSAVHAAEVVHRNLSPASVLIDADDSIAPRARLGEFGLSEVSNRSRLEALQITSAGLTLPGDLAGEALYLAPERLAGSDATAASDIYALGVLLLQMATGDLKQSLVGDWQHALSTQPLAELVAACTSALPEARPDAACVAERLRAFAQAVHDAERIDPVVSHAGETRAPAPASAPAAAGQPAATDPAVGSHIGPYRLIDQLGEGGMGVVYLAEQQQPVQRKVALKVVRTGLMSPDVRARFEAERQAMALMNHANVASVFDAGSTPAGQPYFAMEYVQGQDITAHCDQRRLDFRGRIALFLQVCEGVLHAHQKGLVHRDLKPGNILVSRVRDQAAVVKIIDFGVAKSMSGLLAANPAHTRLGSFVGTPAYSSPEQISGPVASVDTRADIYSLGVVLYELLSGVTPYSEDQLSRKTPVELARLLSGEHPPSPLVRYASLGPEEEQSIAERRALTVEEMKAELDADLSWIVGKCLEVEPDDRYPSVLELEKDLKRWLEDKPVHARPASQLYKLRKFVRRHRLGVAMATLATLALLTTTGAAVYGYLRAEEAREEAEMAVEFQVKQIQGLDPNAMGTGLREAMQEHVRKLGNRHGWDTAEIARRQKELHDLTGEMDFTGLAVDQLNEFSFKPALATIEKDYVDHPLLQAQLWQTMTGTYYTLGQLKDALATQELALASRRRLLGERHPLTLQSIMMRARLHVELGDNAAAEADARNALNGLLSSLGENDLQTIGARALVANSVVRQGRFDEAMELHMENLARRSRILGRNHPDTIKSVSAISWLLLNAGRNSDALQRAEETESLLKSTPEDEEAKLFNWNVLGLIHIELGNIDRAEIYLRKALDVSRRMYGEEHRGTILHAGNLMAIDAERGKCAEVEAKQHSILHGIQQELGDNSQDLLDERGRLATFIACQGRLNEAESIYRETLRETVKSLGHNHVIAQKTARSLASTLIDLGRADEARRLLEARLKMFTPPAGTNSIPYAETAQLLGRTHTRNNRYTEAAVLFRDALHVRRRLQGDSDPGTIGLMIDIAELSTAIGRFDKSEPILRNLLKILPARRADDKVSRTNDIARIDATKALIHALRAQGKYEESAKLGEEMIQTAGTVYDVKDFRLGIILTDHARTLIALRRFDEAEGLLDDARANFLQAYDTDPNSIMDLVSAYITLYEVWNTAGSNVAARDNIELWKNRRISMQSKIGERITSADLR